MQPQNVGIYVMLSPRVAMEFNLAQKFVWNLTIIERK